jgi:aminopeptidase
VTTRTFLHGLRRMNALALVPVLLACARTNAASPSSAPTIRALEATSASDATALLNYNLMATYIDAALGTGPDDRVILRADPAMMPQLARETERALRSAGAKVEVMPYGSVTDFARRLDAATVYVWLPMGPEAAMPPAQVAELRRWLDAGKGRQVHFHWGAGTVGLDGRPAGHTSAFDSIYVGALIIDYEDLDRRQEQAIAALRAGEVHVTTPAGTDLRFSVGDRPFNKQNGNATRSRMLSARTRIDREIELPAGVIRVAPLEETVNGTMVVPTLPLGSGTGTMVRLTFTGGKVSAISAATNEAGVRAFLSGHEPLTHFREFGLGLNPKLRRLPDDPRLPYYGYGAGVVRLSLGDNSELGGTVRGGEVQWLFFPDATVTVGERTIVEGGRLAAVRR